MKKGKWGLRIIVSLLILFQSSFILAQKKYVLDNALSSLSVTGTSTLHNWHMVVTNYSGAFNALINEQNDIVIKSGDFVCDANSITSDNSMMDNKAHDALNTDRYKQIAFYLINAASLVVNGGTIESKIIGELHISGHKHAAMLPINGTIDTEGNIKIVGAVDVKMSDFNIKPPSALMGTVKSGDDVTIHYQLIFKIE